MRPRTIAAVAELIHSYHFLGGGNKGFRRHFARLALPLVSWLVVFFSCVTSSFAQNAEYTKNIPDASLRGEMRVDPSTLGMSIRVPLGGAPGRAGTSLPVSLRYSSKLWRIEYGAAFPTQLTTHTWAYPRFSENSIAGWTSSIEPPRIEVTGQNQLYRPNGQPVGGIDDSESYVYYVRRVHLHMPDGSSHELRKDDQPLGFYVYEPVYDFAGNFYAVDGSRTRYDADAGVLYLPDGGRYVFGQPQSITRYGHAVEGRWGTTYIDRNGNTMTYNMDTRTWTDTMGRAFGNPLPDNPTAGQVQSYGVPGVGGQVTYTLHWKSLADALNVPGEPLRYTSNTRCLSPTQYTTISPSMFASSGTFHICAAAELFNPVVLAKIELPTGQAYEFKYNAWGEIEKVIYPFGGYERYNYAQVATLSRVTGAYNQANRGVVGRWVSPSGGGLEEGTHHWQYSLTRSGTVVTAATTAPDGTHSERLLHSTASQTAFGFESPLAGMTYEERVYNAANQMMRRTLTEWEQTGPTPGASQGARNPRVKKQVELVLDTGGDALAKTTTTQYDTTYEFSTGVNVRSVSEYHFAPVDQGTAQTGVIGSMPSGLALRTTETDYMDGVAAYRDRNLLGLVAATSVKDAGQNIVAQSEMKYDEAAYAPLPCGATVGWSDPGEAVRGSVTTVRRWAGGGEWVETHAQFDGCGSARKSWDANDNMSQVEYSSDYHYAYPTSTTSPVPDPSGVHGSTTALTTSAEYDFSTGLVTAQTDANGQTTTFNYDDSLNRLKRVIRPDDGETSYTYLHNQYGHFVVTVTSLDADRATQSHQYFDGLGRPARSFLRDPSDPNPWLTTNTQYDALGRVWRVSNPYRTNGAESDPNESSVKWTTTGYDALGRVRTVTTSDTATVTTSYRS